MIQDYGLGMTDILTSEYFCDLIGTATAETISIKKSNSIGGDIEEYGQKNISTLKRNLLNKDEILRIESTKLISILRGNEPLLLDKMMYQEHTLYSKLKNSSILDYNPMWIKNVPTQKKVVKTKEEKQTKEDEEIDWNTF